MFEVFDQSLWLDEAISAIVVKNLSLFDIITKFSPGDVHPPLYYLILKIWTNFFGYSEISLRFPSILATLGTIYFVYKIGRKLFDRNTGLLSALFLAVNPLVFYYALEARMYALAMLEISLVTYFFLTKHRLLFSLTFLAALYTDYLVWLAIPVFLPLSLAPLLLTIPLLLMTWQQFQASFKLSQDFPLWGKTVGGFDLKALALTPVKFIFGRIPSHPLMVFPSAIYCWFLFKSRNRFLWLWLLVPLSLASLISLKVPIFTYHRFLFTVPAFCLLLANSTVKNKLANVFIITVSLASIFVFSSNPSNFREDWREASAYINSDPGKVVMPNLTQSPALIYYKAIMDHGSGPVYLIRYVQEIFDPTDSQRKFLETTGYKNVEQRNFNGVIVWKYVL